MKIELSELKNEDLLADGRDPKILAGYVYVQPNGAWHAFRVSTGFEKSGDGSLAVLEPGIWISNLKFDASKSIERALPGIVLHSDHWLKMQTDTILTAWGMTGANGRTVARLMASIVHRACALVLEAVEAWDASSATHRRAAILLGSRPSLATAIAGILEKDLLSNRSAEAIVESMLSKTYQLGMSSYVRKNPPEGFVNLSFNFPRLSYALALTREQVPNGGLWKLGPRSAGVSEADFYAAAAKLKEPLIFRTSSFSTTRNDNLDVFAGNNQFEGTYRGLYTRDEYELLRKEWGDTAQSVFVGSGWSASVVGKFLDAFVDVCGGRNVASLSFTANLVAENIFAAAFRKPKRDTGSEPPEAVWLAARDRVVLYPVIQDFVQFGASLRAAQHGGVQIQCPVDPELLSGVLETAWRHGMTLPMDRVAEISALGVAIPYDRASFGGNPVDYTFCAIAQTGKKKSLFVLDEIMDVDQADRSDRMRALFS